MITSTNNTASCVLRAGLFDQYNIFMLEMNQENRLGMSDAEFQCPTCLRRYKHKFSLKFHQKYECGVDRQFQCIECGKTFIRNSHLKVHMINVHKKLLPKWRELGFVTNSDQTSFEIVFDELLHDVWVFFEIVSWLQFQIFILVELLKITEHQRTAPDCFI